MYGLIGRFFSKPGERDALIAAMSQDVAPMPGCVSYIIARDSQDENGIWVTEVWDSAASHRASLSMPSVQAAIARAKPLIASMGEYFETEPVAGPSLK